MGSIRFDFPPGFEEIQLRNVWPGTMVTITTKSGLFLVIEPIMEVENMVTVVSMEDGQAFHFPANTPCTIWAGYMEVYQPDEIKRFLK